MSVCNAYYAIFPCFEILHSARNSTDLPYQRCDNDDLASVPPAAQEGRHDVDDKRCLGLEVELGGFHQVHFAHRKVTEGEDPYKLHKSLKQTVSASEIRLPPVAVKWRYIPLSHI